MGLGVGVGRLLSPPRVCPAPKRQDSETSTRGAGRRGPMIPQPGGGRGGGEEHGRPPGRGPSGRPPPLLGDALGQLGAGGRGVGREDSVAGAGGVHGRACGGAGSRGAEGRGHGERGQQQQLFGHRPARGAVTAAPRGAAAGTVPTEAAARPGGPAAEGAEQAGAGGGRPETPTLLVPKATTSSGGTCVPRDRCRGRLRASGEAAAPSGDLGIREAAARASAEPPSPMRAGRRAALCRPVLRETSRSLSASWLCRSHRSSFAVTFLGSAA